MNRDLERVVAHLRTERISCAVIGATAMAIHGVSRATQDIDLLTTSRACLREQFWKPLRDAGMDIDVREGDHDDPLAGVVRIYSQAQGTSIDIIIGRSSWQTSITASAQTRNVDGVELPVAEAVDLILLKLYAGGIQDRWDISQLLATSPALAGQVDARIGQLPESCLALWNQLRAIS